MCFSAAVIIILGTQTQTNPLNRTPRDREWGRQERSSDCTHVRISTTAPFEGGEKERKGGMTCMENKTKQGGLSGESENQQQQISLSTSSGSLLKYKPGDLITVSLRSRQSGKERLFIGETCFC